MPIILCTRFSYMAGPEQAKQTSIRAVMKPLTKSEIEKTIRRALGE
jgi:hypothetical protein